MVQPYLEAVDHEGEIALLYTGGVFSHAVRKAPILAPGGGPGAGLYIEERITATEPSPEELELAEHALAVVPFPRDELLYARVDLLPGPVVLEVELTEPSLFLGYADGAVERFAAAIAAASQRRRISAENGPTTSQYSETRAGHARRSRGRGFPSESREPIAVGSARKSIAALIVRGRSAFRQASARLELNQAAAWPPDRADRAGDELRRGPREHDESVGEEELLQRLLARCHAPRADQEVERSGRAPRDDSTSSSARSGGTGSSTSCRSCTSNRGSQWSIAATARP